MLSSIKNLNQALCSTTAKLILLFVICRGFPQKTRFSNSYPLVPYIGSDTSDLEMLAPDDATTLSQDNVYDFLQNVRLFHYILDGMKESVSQMPYSEGPSSQGASILPLVYLTELSKQQTPTEYKHNMFGSLLPRDGPSSSKTLRAMERPKKDKHVRDTMFSLEGTMSSQQQFCGMVCDQCQRLLSLRWSSLCRLECARGHGDAFSGCLAMIQHTIKHARSVLGVMQK